MAWKFTAACAGAAMTMAASATANAANSPPRRRILDMVPPTAPMAPRGAARSPGRRSIPFQRAAFTGFTGPHTPHAHLGGRAITLRSSPGRRGARLLAQGSDDLSEVEGSGGAHAAGAAGRVTARQRAAEGTAGYGTTVTGQRPALTRRTATEPRMRSPASSDA